MEFTGRYVIPAPPEVVWAAINDPEILKACIPGCQVLEKTGPNELLATATLKIGPVKATFKGRVTLSELDPPRRCVLTGEGQGGVAGFAKGQAEVILTPEADGTMLAYRANASVGGKLAQIGQRLIDGAAKQIADDFFAKFGAAISAASVPSAAPVEDGVLEQELFEEPPSRISVAPAPLAGPRQGLAPEIWVVGLVGVIVILLILFGVVL